MAGGTAPELDATRAPQPPILVVIPTRNRPADLARCLESLVQVSYPTWELLIVDQSDDDTGQSLAEAYQDRLPKVGYLRTRQRGVCRARNLALQGAGAGIVAFLDDDCTVDAGWLTEVAAAFLRHPSAPLIFGSVHAAPHDPRQVFIPTVAFVGERVLRRSFTHAGSGMGASMYLWPARSAHPHRFDVHLGAGTRWPSAEEGDLACRVLRAGESVVLTSGIGVCHHGARSLQGRAVGMLFRGYALGFGAMDMKMIRCGDWESLWRALDHTRRYMIGVLSALATGRRPLGLGSLAMYLRGMAESFLLPVDRAQCLYVTAKPMARQEASR